MALVALGENPHQAHRASDAFMCHDEAELRDSATDQLGRAWPRGSGGASEA